MAISPLSNRSSALNISTQDFVKPRIGGVQHGGCGSKQAHGLRSDFQKDSFSAGPSKGAQFEKFMKGLNDVVKELQHLTEMLQGQGLGGAKPGVGGGSPASSPSASSPSASSPSASSPSASSPSAAQGPSGAAAPQAPSAAGAGEAPKGEVGDWIKEAQKLLAQAGIPADKMNAQDIARIIEHESSGNPNAVNNWDDNAKAGHPSIGLMQTIQPTFDAYKLPGHDNIRNPVDNIVAAVRYSVDKYGSVSNVPGIKGLNGGGGYVGY
jgi:hypothetical protein